MSKKVEIDKLNWHQYIEVWRLYLNKDGEVIDTEFSRYARSDSKLAPDEQGSPLPMSMMKNGATIEVE
jgi:hypothetical protein